MSWLKSPARAPQRTMNDLGFTHLSVKVPDVKAALEKLEALGVEIDRSTVIEMSGFTVAAFVRDPDGLGIELVIQH